MNLADTLNLGCACQTLDPDRLREQLETTPTLQGLTARLARTHPHLFSATAVFLDHAVNTQLVEAVAALERVMDLPAWQVQALVRAHPIAQQNWGPAGVFMGYDFHLAADGPKLIEINSNAGGALLNAALARAHRACCGAMPDTPAEALAPLEGAFLEMFRSEWLAQRGNTPLRNVLIVDDDPNDLRLIGRMLSENGRYRPILAEGGRNGWEAAQARAPHALILDLFMPEMDGFSLLEKMRSSEKLRDVPVIVVSGGDLTPEQKEQLQDFGHRMIQKSALTEKQLITTLERALERVKH